MPASPTWGGGCPVPRGIRLELGRTGVDGVNGGLDGNILLELWRASPVQARQVVLVSVAQSNPGGVGNEWLDQGVAMGQNCPVSSLIRQRHHNRGIRKPCSKSVKMLTCERPRSRLPIRQESVNFGLPVDHPYEH